MKKSANICTALTLLTLSSLLSTCSNTSIRSTNPIYSSTSSANIQLLESIENAFVNIANQIRVFNNPSGPVA